MGLDHFELEIESEASKIETVLQTKRVLQCRNPRRQFLVM